MKIENQTPFETTALPMMGRGGCNTLTVIVKATFAFDGGKVELAPDQTPIAYGDLLYDKEEGGGIAYETDLVPFKPKTDVVLSGKAYAPNNEPAEIVNVALKVGPVKKQLRVFGRRLWNFAGILSRKYTVTDTEPFVSCRISYNEAFGGIDSITGEYCDRNLSGKGFYSKDAKNKLVGLPLPRIEDPRHLIRSPKDHPRPVGFGFYHRSWQPRAACAGTYDEKWRAKRCPKQPEDFNFHFYNGAHPDLQVKGYLKGSEPVELTNLTPEGQVQFKLPGVSPLCRIERTQERKDEQEPERIRMNLDTLFIEPDQRTFCQVWRGNAPLGRMNDTEIKEITIAASTLPQRKQPPAITKTLKNKNETLNQEPKIPSPRQNYKASPSCRSNKMKSYEKTV